MDRANDLNLESIKRPKIIVWPDKNRQMSKKVAQNDFTRKMNDFDNLQKLANIVGLFG